MRRTSLAGSRRPLEGDDLDKVEVVRLAEGGLGVLLAFGPLHDLEAIERGADRSGRGRGPGAAQRTAPPTRTPIP